jgi:hypothetical protein
MRNDRGFTLAEVLVVAAIFMTISAMGTAILMSSITMMRADSEAQRLIGLFQLARETAIMRQRDIELVFDLATNRARLVLHDGGVETPLREVSLEHGVSFHQFGGVPDTPDGFGAGDAIDFNGAARLIFISDGSFVGADDLPVNGTVFLGMPGRNETARAVTLTGATSRARVYRWSGAWWEQ